jgi:DNA polymerase III gamma/tau subunit
MGSLGVALRLDNEEFLERRRSWAEKVSSLTSGDYRAASEAAEAIASNKEEALQFLEWAETWYRDLLIHAVTENSAETINVDMLAEIRSQAANGQIERLLSTFAQTARAAGRIQRNLNRRMVLESLFFNVVGRR